MAVDLASGTETLTCCTCGIPIVLSIPHARRLRESGDWFHCVNGHPQHFTETTAEKLRRANHKIGELEERLERINGYWRSAQRGNEARDRTISAYQANIGKARKRRERLERRVAALEAELATTRNGNPIEPAEEATHAR